MALYIPSINLALKNIKAAYFNEDYAKIKEIMDYIVNTPTIAGSEDDYHNVAVELVRFEDYHNAVLLLQHGLERYGNSTDILADLLSYGLNCRKTDEIKDYYFKKLAKINKRFWSWRAFRFSIDFLMTYIQYTENDKQENSLVSEIKQLIADYKQYMPDDERAFMVEHDFYELMNEHDLAKTALQTALKTLTICPQCALKYADGFFETGNYEEVIPLIERINNMLEAQPSINMGYAYYILALSKEAVLKKTRNAFTADNVKPIFDAYYCALENISSGRNTIANEIYKRVVVLERMSGVKSEIKTNE